MLKVVRDEGARRYEKGTGLPIDINMDAVSFTYSEEDFEAAGLGEDDVRSRVKSRAREVFTSDT